MQLLKSDGICLKGWCSGNIDCNRASWVSKFRKINQISYCVTFLYMWFTIWGSVRYLTMSRNFLVVLHNNNLRFYIAPFHLDQSATTVMQLLVNHHNHVTSSKIRCYQRLQPHLHSIGDVANSKRHQQLNEIFIIFYPHYTGNQKSCL